MRLLLSPELKELAGSATTQEIHRAIEAKLNVSCQLDLAARQDIVAETPVEVRNRHEEAARQAAIDRIKSSETVSRFNRAFGAELVESSVTRSND